MGTGRHFACAVLASAAVTLSSCTTAGHGHPIPLDGTAHPATDAGVVTAVDLHQVVLDGTRRYRVAKHLQAFLPRTLQPTPLLGTAGRYVLIGATGSQIDWLEALSVVVSAGEQRAAYYFGTMTGTDRAGRVIFTDGTVLAVKSGTPLPSVAAGPVTVRAEIDPGDHLVRAFAPG